MKKTFNTFAFGIIMSLLYSCGSEITQEEFTQLEKEYRDCQGEYYALSQKIEKVQNDTWNVKAEVAEKVSAILEQRKIEKAHTLNTLLSLELPSFQIIPKEISTYTGRLKNYPSENNLLNYDEVYATSNYLSGHRSLFRRGTTADIILAFQEGSINDFFEKNIKYVTFLSNTYEIRTPIKLIIQKWINTKNNFTKEEIENYEIYFEKVKNNEDFDSSSREFKTLAEKMDASSDEYYTTSDWFCRYKEWSFWKRRSIDGIKENVLLAMQYLQKNL